MNQVARKMIGCYGVTSTDLSDILQEFRIALLNAYPHYNPEKGPYFSYAKSVIQNQRCKFFRTQEIQRLDVTMTIGIPHGEKAVHLDQMLRKAKGANSDNMLREIDVAITIAGLSPLAQKTCQYIMAGFTLREIPQKLEINNYMFFNKILKEIQSLFKDF